MPQAQESTIQQKFKWARQIKAYDPNIKKKLSVDSYPVSSCEAHTAVAITGDLLLHTINTNKGRTTTVYTIAESCNTLIILLYEDTGTAVDHATGTSVSRAVTRYKWSCWPRERNVRVGSSNIVLNRFGAASVGSCWSLNAVFLYYFSYRTFIMRFLYCCTGLWHSGWCLLSTNKQKEYKKMGACRYVCTLYLHLNLYCITSFKFRALIPILDVWSNVLKSKHQFRRASYVHSTPDSRALTDDFDASTNRATSSYLLYINIHKSVPVTNVIIALLVIVVSRSSTSTAVQQYR